MLFARTIILLCLFSVINGARILAIIPTPAYSHQIVFRPMWKALLARGHHLTLLTTNPILSHVNLTQIDLQFAYDLINKTALITKYKRSFIDIAEDFLMVRTKIYDEEMKHEEVRKLIKNNNDSFDLLIVEYVMPAFYAFKHKYKCPFIGVVPYDAPGIAHTIIGNPIHPIAYPDMLLSFNTNEFTFKERLLSVLFFLYMKYYSFYRLFPVQEEMVKKHFGNDIPSLISIAEEVDMLFINSHLLYNVRPSVPAVIYMGPGQHLESDELLNEELQTYLDNSKLGVIYMSLGTNVKSSDLSKRTIKIILKTFSQLPYNVLWKFEDELHEKPSNVKTFNWLPQVAILRHPNVVLFITQGGVQSIDEGIYYKKPMLGIPFYGDQTFNIMKLVSNSIGLYINHQHFNKDAFKASIEEIIDNPKYKLNVERIRNLLLDQPMETIDRIVWWTEYVIRNNGTKHLKGKSFKIPFYHYYFLDVLGLFIAVIAIVAFLLVQLFKFIFTSYKLKND